MLKRLEVVRFVDYIGGFQGVSRGFGKDLEGQASYICAAVLILYQVNLRLNKLFAKIKQNN